MKRLEWSVEKNEWLKATRSISFERIADIIENDEVVDIIDHPNSEKYPGQRVFIVEFEEYLYMIPYVETEAAYFLKTIIPSRKLTKRRRRSGEP